MQVSDSTQLKKLAEAMYLVSTAADKGVRQRAEMTIYDFERMPGQITRLFELLIAACESQAPEMKIVRKGCLAHLSHYVNKQFSLGNGEPKEPRVQMFSTMTHYIGKLCQKNYLTEHELSSVRSDFASMMKAYCNISLTVSFITDIGHSLAKQPEKLIINCHYLLAVVTSIANDPQMTRKVYAKCFDPLVAYLKNVMKAIKLDSAVLDVVWLILRVIDILFDKMDPDEFVPVWTAIIRDGNLLSNFVQTLETGDRRVEREGVRILTHVIKTNNMLKVDFSSRTKEPGTLSLLKKKMLPQIIQFSKEMVQTLIIEEKEDKDRLELLHSYFGFFFESIGAHTMEMLVEQEKEILFEVILPCLRPTKHLQRLIDEDPEEYYKRRADLCQKQEIDTIEGSAMKIMESLCDDVDGAATFVVGWAVSVIRNAIQPAVPMDKAYIQSPYFKTTDQAIKIEVALSIITSLSYSYGNRPDLIALIESAVKDALPLMCQPSRPNIYMQFCLLLAYNVDVLFTGKSEIAAALLENLLINLNAVGNSPLVVLIACETILDLMCQQNYKLIFEAHIKTIARELLKCVSGHFRENALEVIRQFVKLYPKQIKAEPQIFHSIFESLSVLLKQTKLNESVPDSFVLSLLNWIEDFIMLNDDPDLINGFVSVILSLFSVPLADNPYVDRLLRISNIFMQKGKSVPFFIIPLFRDIQGLLSFSDPARQKLAFISLNHIINYFHDSESLNSIAAVCSKNFTSTLTPTGQTNPLLFLMLMHLLLSLHFSLIHPTILEEVLQKTCATIKIKYVRRKAGQYCLYLLILLEFMKNNLESVTNYLKNQGTYHQLCQILYESATAYAGDMPSKIFVLCQLALLSNPNFDPVLSTNSFRLVISLMRTRCAEKQDRKGEEIDDEDSSDVEILDQQPLEASFYKLLKTPYRQRDELDLFKQVIRQLNTNSDTRSRFQSFLHDLPVALKNFVSESLSLNKVKLSDGGVQVRKMLHVRRTLQ